MKEMMITLPIVDVDKTWKNVSIYTSYLVCFDLFRIYSWVLSEIYIYINIILISTFGHEKMSHNIVTYLLDYIYLYLTILFILIIVKLFSYCPKE